MPKGKSTSDDGVSAALVKAVNAGIVNVKAARDGLEGQDLASKTQDERGNSNGKLREGEAAAMVNILDTVDKFPGLFASIAPRDHGVDDSVVETDPARAALARIALLQPLQAELTELLSRVSDDILESAELAKDVTVPAYAIIKANEAIAPEVRKAAAPALTFYANVSRKKKPRAKPPAK